MKTPILISSILICVAAISQEARPVQPQIEETKPTYGNHKVEKQAYMKEFNAFVIKRKGTTDIPHEEKLRLRKEFNAIRSKK